MASEEEKREQRLAEIRANPTYLMYQEAYMKKIREGDARRPKLLDTLTEDERRAAASEGTARDGRTVRLVPGWRFLDRPVTDFSQKSERELVEAERDLASRVDSAQRLALNSRIPVLGEDRGMRSDHRVLETLVPLEIDLNRVREQIRLLRRQREDIKDPAARALVEEVHGRGQ